jgi:hypothetical protein
MTETQERFLRTVLTRVSLDDVVELHLFPPIRRGTMETGVAVIATVLPRAPLTVLETAADETEQPVDVPATDEPDAVAAELRAADDEPEALADDAAVSQDMTIDADVDVVVDAGSDAGAVEAAASDVPLDDSPYADDAVSDADADLAVSADDAIEGSAADTMPVDEPVVDVAPAPVPSPRMRILTAAYRHTIKGIDRGKWTVDVQDEADAPLDAVEAVLRGVRHRSTEPADPELVSLDALAALLAPTRVAPAA